MRRSRHTEVKFDTIGSPRGCKSGVMQKLRQLYWIVCGIHDSILLKDRRSMGMKTMRILISMMKWCLPFFSNCLFCSDRLFCGDRFCLAYPKETERDRLMWTQHEQVITTHKRLINEQFIACAHSQVSKMLIGAIYPCLEIYPCHEILMLILWEDLV